MKNIISHYGTDHHNALAKQLELFPLQKKSHTRQISSIPGISPKVRNRYRVTLGGKVLGNQLTLDEALKLAKGGKL